jgi:hypothetical protein
MAASKITNQLAASPNHSVIINLLLIFIRFMVPFAQYFQLSKRKKKSISSKNYYQTIFFFFHYPLKKIIKSHFISILHHSHLIFIQIKISQ